MRNECITHKPPYPIARLIPRYPYMVVYKFDKQIPYLRD